MLDILWTIDPVEASGMGVTKYDGKLPPADLDERRQCFTSLADLVRRMEEMLGGPSLSPSEALDFEVAVANARVMLSGESVAPEWRINPQWHLTAVNDGLHTLVSRAWMPVEDRLIHLAERLAAIPGFVQKAKQNLNVREIPPEWIDIAIGSVDGHRLLIDRSVLPFAGSSAKAPPEFDRLCRESVEAVDSFGRYLKSAAGEAKGTFACGRDQFETILRTVHMVDMDADRLLKFGKAKVDEYEAAIIQAAKAIDPAKHWTLVFKDVKEDHPRPEHLLDSYRNEIRLAEEFTVAKDLITIPKGQTWSVLPVPEFSRATHPMGYMRTSLPFTTGLDSVLYITPIDVSASPERQKQHLEDSCYPFLRSIAFHEVIPGHHLQSCLSKVGISDLRKQFRSTVFIEGWGLYTEHLMAEQGYLSEPGATLVNLRNALWRAVRVVVDVGLHVNGMTLDEATRMLQEKVRMEHHMAAGEAKRYTMSPTYQSSYLLGKEEIVRLREDYKLKMGPAFRLKDFHDKLNSYGSIPVALVRREMMR